MAKEINPPRGMRDFLPAEKAKRENVLGVIKGVYSSFGFQEVETPALENLDRLTSGQGGDNEKLAYRVMKRGAELDSALESLESVDVLADLGLRFDLTVPLTRFYSKLFRWVRYGGQKDHKRVDTVSLFNVILTSLVMTQFLLR
jgi:histidyl-tRNA synthetase